MPAVLTHKAITLLARRRLREVRDALQARSASAAGLNKVEQRVLSLAREAYRILGTPPHPNTDFPGAPFVRPFGKGASLFAIMGSMGPDITGFSALLKPGQAWVFDTVHKGTPDANRELVVAGTCDLIFDLWRRVSDKVNREVPEAKKAETLDQMRAYVLGHLCHIAGDVLSHPWTNDVEWHRGKGDRDHFEHQAVEVSHDAQVAQTVFRRRSTRSGADWDEW